jgi:hypothetical protein
MKYISEQTGRVLAHRLGFFSKKGLPPMIVIGWVLLFSLIPSALAQEKTMIYFYSAESNITNFKVLKMEFDSYLAGFGAYEFQPFSDREAFEKQIKGKAQCLLLLSSWHFTNIYKDYALKPVLVGVVNGKKYQKRLLVTTDKAVNPESVKTGQIASASSVQHTRSTLQEMFKAPQETGENLKILTVPKDLDALMSVGFGMAKSALITESSLEKLKTVNPPLYNKMNVLAESTESLLLIVAVPESFAQDAEPLITLLQKMAATPEGKSKIKLLGFDDWQPLDSLDEAKLEG